MSKRNPLSKRLATLMLSVTSLLLSGCATRNVPDAGAQHRLQVVEQDEAGLWAQMDRIEALMQEAPERVRDPALQAYVDGLKCKLAPDICADIRIYVLRQAQFNAFMTPNGAMGLFTGLLLRCEDEAQLASVIGHEIAHYRKRHVLENWRRAKNTAGWVTVIGLLAGGSGVGALATIGAYVNFASFSRTQEKEADEVGFAALVQANYASEAPSRIWANVLAEEKLNPRPFLSGLFASHPSSPERQKYLADMAKQASANASVERGQISFANAIAAHRNDWLDDELARRAYRQSELLLNRLSKIPYGQSQISHAQGELFRKRGQPGDLERAAAAYQRAAKDPKVSNEVFRDLGLTLKKLGDVADANTAFQEYLKRSPQADDAAMIRSYINAR